MGSISYKRIVICCDGTWDDSDGTNQPPTNVTKLARSIQHVDRREDGRPIQQIVYYQSGVGSQVDTKINAQFDGATGKGISDHVRQAYGFLCNNYDDGDEIFIVGFSRGAFTARTISSLIHDVGLLTQHGLGYFISIFRAWERQNQGSKDIDTRHLGNMDMSWSELRSQLEKTDLTRPDIKIKVCAVWDTVGSLGLPVASSLLSRWGLSAFDHDPNPYSFVNTEVCDNIEHAFHAIALDEHRAHFEPTIWERPDGQAWPVTLKQCWFTGYHTHIGGGNDDNNMLPNIALAWMMTQLKDHLAIDYSIVKTKKQDQDIAKALHLEGEADPDSGELKDSKTGWFTLDGLGTTGTRSPTQYSRTDPKTLKPKAPREPLANTHETIHASVRRRFWDKEFKPYDKHPYRSNALLRWRPLAEPTPRWVYDGDEVGEEVGEKGKGMKDIMEEEMTEYELDIYRCWDPAFAGIEDFDLQHATH